MNERLLSLSIQGFRGMADEFSLTFPNGSGLVVLGHNGTGKSSIADALEYYFTGKIRPLAKEGRGIVHNLATGQANTRITVETTGRLSGKSDLEKAPAASAAINPKENFILRGRTLAEFVDKTKGEKRTALCNGLALA
jgi:AAA15 family ATPase/GTPase